ncbi:MAG: lipopolysaccharide kinase InaA family protein [Clostridium sp.]|nr:lipopolysaccharide kinase InaA family protein [Clostridium sp.]
MKIVMEPSHRWANDFTEHLAERFDREGDTLHEGRNRVKAFNVDGQILIVKRYKRPHLIQRVAYTWFRPSKARRAYLFALRLKQLGIATPEPVAYLEERRWGLFRDSYFVSARCTDPTLFPVLVDKTDYDPQLAAALAAEVVEWHRKGFLHGDLNLANIMYRPKAGGGYAFTVIDINRSHFINNPGQDECLTNLMRLTHRVDLLRFLVEHYARLRGWEPESCCDAVEAKLHAFEQRRARKRKLKHAIHP